QKQPRMQSRYASSQRAEHAASPLQPAAQLFHASRHPDSHADPGGAGPFEAVAPAPGRGTVCTVTSPAPPAAGGVRPPGREPQPGRGCTAVVDGLAPFAVPGPGAPALPPLAVALAPPDDAGAGCESSRIRCRACCTRSGGWPALYD